MKSLFTLMMLGSISLLIASPLHVDCQPRLVRLGDVITYRIVINAPRSTPVTFDPNWPSTGNLNLLVVTDSIKKAWTRTYYLSAFTLDKAWLPTLSVRVNDKPVSIKPIPIKVQSSFEKNEQKKFSTAIKPQAHISIHWGAYLIVVLFITLIVVALILIYRRFFNKPSTDIGLAITSLTPFEIALERLRLLELQDYPTEDDQKKLMFELSHLLRQYLETTFARPFMEETTYEIGFSLPKFVTKELTEAVLHYLQQLDPIKYAKGSMSMNELKGRTVMMRDLLNKLEAFHGI